MLGSANEYKFIPVSLGCSEKNVGVNLRKIYLGTLIFECVRNRIRRYL